MQLSFLCPRGRRIALKPLAAARAMTPTLRDCSTRLNLEASSLCSCQRQFQAATILLQGYLAGPEPDEQVHCAPIDWLELDEWHGGRVILVSDAAHASSPMMGREDA